MEKSVVYFSEVGKENTDQVLELAAEAARAQGIRHVFFASTRGTRLSELWRSALI